MTGGRSVLLVEDDGLLAGIIQRYLGVHGHPVRIVATVEDAGRALDKERPKLILLDINLPGDLGWSLLAKPAMRAEDAPPVVVVSSGTVSPRRLRESGAAGYPPKPFPLDALLATVERFTPAAAQRPTR